MPHCEQVICIRVQVEHAGLADTICFFVIGRSTDAAEPVDQSTVQVDLGCPELSFERERQRYVYDG